jgi:hypothetical protein
MGAGGTVTGMAAGGAVAGVAVGGMAAGIASGGMAGAADRDMALMRFGVDRRRLRIA